MNHWLLKSEPAVWSWEQQLKAGATHWNGVRNHQAANFMRAMKKGDTAFFYHSNEGKEIVGIVTIAQPFYPDPEDETGKFGLVDVKAQKTLPAPVTLAQIKATPALRDMALLRQSRLSVSPVTAAEWAVILGLAGA